ncbi:MAG: polysaccharide biosynthesis C-terminal domain-containing protein [Bacteroidetes bacterium]|jgi:O-antigen/teichoic acid export membrane protein|nr:polysaccharide biosynthesis C-terminal domain-containing protein [Bacteroidota bacterium]
MQNRFVKNLALLLFLNLLIKPFWILGVDRAVQNTVGDASYGFYSSVFSFSFLFYILLDLGITNFNNRNIAQNNQLLNKHLAGITVVKMLLVILYGFVIFLIGFLIGYDGQQLKLLAWVGINQVLLSFILYLRSNISGLLLFKTDSFLSVFDRLLMILICGFLLWSGFFKDQFRIEWYVYAQTFAYTVTIVVATFFVLKYSGKIKLNFSLPFSLMIIKKSIPYALLVLLMSFYNRLEPVLIERILGGELGKIQTGIYSRAFRLLDAGNNISLLFSVLLLPMFASLIKKKQAVKEMAKLSFSLIISMSSIVAILSIFYSTEIMQLLYGLQSGESVIAFEERIRVSAAIFRLLMGSFVAVSVTYIFGTLLTANGNLKMLNIIAASGVVVNVAINFLLIPQWQALGAAYASLSVQVFTAFLQFLLAWKIFKLNFGFSFWLRLAAFVMVAILASFFSRLLPYHWIINFALAAVISLLASFFSGLLRLSELSKLLFVRQKSS